MRKLEKMRKKLELERREEKIKQALEEVFKGKHANALLKSMICLSPPCVIVLPELERGDMARTTRPQLESSPMPKRSC